MTTKFVIVEQKMQGRWVALRGLSFETKEAAQAHIDRAINERYRKRFHVESRLVKPDETSLRMTCQCCGRGILAKTGTIAHHGYERPDWGYQTASCYGAKELPWEVSRDALGRMITALQATLKRQQEYLEDTKQERCEIVHRYKVYEPHRKPTFASDSFTRKTLPAIQQAKPKHYLEFGQSRNDFDYYKAQQIASAQSAIKQTKAGITECQKRYDGWKQTHKREGGQWVAL